jgi:hypothetical protein
MRESTFWRPPRFITLIAVAALHVALIALLIMAGAVQRSSGSYQPVELVYIPAVPPPPVRAESGRPPRLRADITRSPVSPVITSAPSVSMSSGTGSRGLGVDWLAEAHRAVKAYEIRRDQPSDTTLSGKSPANDWWPEHGPHQGDRYKNDAGDWIVWISADCYEVASWHSVDPASYAGPAKIVCPKKSGVSSGAP